MRSAIYKCKFCKRLTGGDLADTPQTIFRGFFYRDATRNQNEQNISHVTGLVKAFVRVYDNS